MMKFIGQTGIIFNKNENSWLNALTDLKGITDIDKDSESNNSYNFYQYLFAQNNLLRQGKSPVYFDASKVGFQYASNLFGPGPMISSDPLESFLGDDGKIYKYAEPTAESTNKGSALNMMDLLKSKNINEGVIGGNGYGYSTSNYKSNDASETPSK
ncbi:hypothetical protein FACS189459_5630 [Bacilli bacterium]|nr:hypothetical protein FACS189459_5630 [Bacilli bacterium]